MRTLTELSKSPSAMAVFASTLAACGVLTSVSSRCDASGGTVRFDEGGATAFLARELEHVSARSFDVLKDPIKGRQFVRFNTEVPDGAESYSYDMWDGVGLAEWITNYSSAVGGADVKKERFSKSVYSFGSSYYYSVDDLAVAAFTRKPIDRERARRARMAHEFFLDDLIALGDSTRGIEGLCNNTVIPDVVPITGAWDGTTTGIQKVNDLQKLVDAPEQASAENFLANRLVLPLSVKPLMKMRYSAEDARSVAEVFLAGQDPGGVTKIEYWKRLNTASAIGGPRALAWKDDPAVCEFLLVFDYQEMPPQQKGYGTQILTRAKVLGLVIRYPLAMAQMDLDDTP